MHRTYRVPRSIFVAALIALAAGLGLDVSSASAQEKATAVQVPINGSVILEMSKKQTIKDIDNQDQNVARVDFLKGDYRKVMITGGAQAGITRLTLTDNDGNKEVFTVIVELNVEYLRRVIAQAAPTANVQVVQGTAGTLILTGTVAQATDIDIIMRTAAGAVGDPTKIVNAMRLGGVVQVQLDVVIARVARSKARAMGFSFSETSVNQFLASSTGGTGSLATLVTNSAGNVISSLTSTPNIAFGIIHNNASFLGFLNALNSESLVKIMAQPKVCTLSGRPAEFISGGEQAVPTLASGGAGGGAVAGVDFRPFGTTVRFLPLVLGGGKIYLEVEPQFTFPDPSNLFSAPIPGTNSVVFGRDTYRVQTSVVIEDGQTFCIGGMIFHQMNGTTQKVPVVGEIPFLAALFSQVTYTDSEEELIILITPHLVAPMACDQLPKFLPGEETRRPDDFELFLERILEAPRCHREVFDGCRYVPAYMNGPTADMFPAPNCNGPRGACDYDMRAGPACRDCQLGGCCANGCGAFGGGCGGTAGCGGGGCNNGCNNTGTVHSPVIAPAAPPAGIPGAQPLPSVQPAPRPPQQLPERSEVQVPAEVIPVTNVLATTPPGVGSPEFDSTRPAEQGELVLPSDGSGTPARLAPPLPHDERP
jgi:pilus assembly protein CpaC